MQIDLASELPAPPASVVTMAHLRTLSLVALAMAMLALFLVCARVAPMPTLVRALEDFDTELPALTRMVVKIPQAGYLLICFAAAVALGFKEWRMRDKGATLLINVGATGAALALWIVLEYAFILPMFTLIQSVSK